MGLSENLPERSLDICKSRKPLLASFAEFAYEGRG